MMQKIQGSDDANVGQAAEPVLSSEKRQSRLDDGQIARARIKSDA